jgi:hypothetical protein
VSEESGWITLATIPPASQEAFVQLAQVLQDSNIELEIEENAVRQCERDPAAWLRVQLHDFARASELARHIVAG